MSQDQGSVVPLPAASVTSPSLATEPATPSGVLRPPFSEGAMPGGIRRLSRSSKGYPVPWFVDRKAPKRDGDHDFRIMDGDRLKMAIREKRCWVCGDPIRSAFSVFVAGPMCGINHTSAEPPCHDACARWSARACPFLAVPKRIRDDRDLPESHQAGFGILRNPGVTMLWTTAKYTTWKPPGGGLLFDIGEPIRVEWIAQGRAATRAEVETSIETGLPLLLKQATQDGALGCFELGRATERFLAHLPTEDGSQSPLTSDGEARKGGEADCRRPNPDQSTIQHQGEEP